MSAPWILDIDTPDPSVLLVKILLSPGYPGCGELFLGEPVCFPVTHLILVFSLEVMAQFTPSILTDVAVEPKKPWPFIVNSCPPSTKPYLIEGSIEDILGTVLAL